MRNLMLIVNPYSGKGHAKNALFDVIDRFNSHGCSVSVFITGTGEERSIQHLAKEHGADYDLVVCMGGDGTLSDTVNGIMNIEDKSRIPIIGYIPVGTANDMANNLVMPKSPAEAATSIATGSASLVDMGFYDNKYFTYIAAFGAFSSVSYETPQKSKNALGHMAYIFEGIAQLPEIKPVHAVVEYDDGVIEGDFVFGCTANSTSVAGLVKLDPTLVGFNDGLFEVILVHKPLSIIDMGKILTNIKNNSFSSDIIDLIHTSKVTFKFDKPVAWTRDGENGGTYQEITIENLHNAINIIRNTTGE